MNMRDDSFMRHHWNRESSKYIDGRRWSAIDQRVVEHIKSFKPHNLLEIGFGSGIVAGEIKKVCPDTFYYGLDISENFIGAANVRLGGWGKFIMGSAANPPLKTNSLDCILEMTAIHHFPKKKIPSVVEQISQLLKPGGELICVEDWAAEPQNEREELALKLRRTAGLTRNNDEYHPGDEEWKEMFLNAGLKVIKLEHDNRPLDISKISDERNPDNSKDLKRLVQLWGSEKPVSRMSVFYCEKE